MLARALAGIRLRYIGQRTLRVISGDVVAEEAVERGDPAVVVNKAVKAGSLGLGLFDCLANDYEDGG